MAALMEPAHGQSPLMAMNMQINRFSNNNAPETPAPARPHARHVSRQGVLSANVATATELTPLDAINGQAGVREGVHFKRRTLSQRAATPARQPRQPNKKETQKKSRLDAPYQEGDDDDDPLNMSPVEDTLDMLREDSGRSRQEEVEAMLAEYFQPMQRYNILHDALEKLEDQPISKMKKNSLRNALNEMMSELMERHPHEMRRALQESDELVNSLEAMAGQDGESRKLPSTRDLRFLIGAKTRGNFDAPLSPLTMLKALIKNFGPDKCLHAMTSLRSRMMSGF
jgi:hypothetical protein